MYEDNAPHIEQAIFDLGCPILGICYGLQEIAHYFAQNVLAGEKREYGQAKLKIEHHKGKAVHIDRLFNGLGDDLEVWMSHGDKISHLPESFATIATTSNAPFAGIAHDTKPYYGIQFVFHSQVASHILSHSTGSILRSPIPLERLSCSRILQWISVKPVNIGQWMNS